MGFETKSIHEKAEMYLFLIDVNGNQEIYGCDSITLYCKNGIKANDGGSIGIRKGHIKAIVSLDTHCIIASLDGNEVYKSDMVSGIALIENDVITVFKD